MHMADALLSPEVGTTFWAGSLAAIAYCTKKLKESLDDRLIPLIGVIAAFIFAAQMINFTIPGTGSSGHLGGGMILAIILGPYAGFIAIASVLIIQSLFFADGGILALGCNIWNLGIYPCFISYPFIYRVIVQDKNNSRRILIASVISVVIGMQLGTFSVIFQTLLSGKSELSFAAFSSVMLPIQLAIGLIEGFITAGVINYVRSLRPEILESVSGMKSLTPWISFKNILLGFLFITIITGGILSWFSSRNPDGLEWSIVKVFGNSELPETEKGIARVLREVQEKTAILPDYRFSAGNDTSREGEPEEAVNYWPDIKPETSVSGITGSIMVLVLIFILGIGIKALRKKKF